MRECIDCIHNNSNCKFRNQKRESIVLEGQEFPIRCRGFHWKRGVCSKCGGVMIGRNSNRDHDICYETYGTPGGRKGDGYTNSRQARIKHYLECWGSEVQ